MDEVTAVKSELERLAQVVMEQERNLENKTSETETLRDECVRLRGELEEARAERESPGDRTQAIETAQCAISTMEAREGEFKEMQEQLDQFKHKNAKLEEELEFLRDEQHVFQGVSEENDSLVKENSSLKSQLASSRLSDMSSVNESALKRSELEAERDRIAELLDAKTAEADAALSLVDAAKKAREVAEMESAECAVHLEMEQKKNARRIDELTRQLEQERGNVTTTTNEATASQTEAVLRTENASQASVSTQDGATETVKTATSDHQAQTDLVDVKYLQGQLLHKEAEVEKAREEIAKLKTQVETLKKSEGELLSQMDRLSSEIVDLKTSNSQAADQLSSTNETSEAVTRRVDELSVQLDAAKMAGKTAVDQVAQLTSRLDEANSTRTTTAEQLALQTERVAHLEREMATKTDELVKTEQMLELVESKLIAANDELKLMREKEAPLVFKPPQQVAAESQVVADKMSLSELGIVDVSNNSAEGEAMTKSEMSALGINEYDVIDETELSTLVPGETTKGESSDVTRLAAERREIEHRLQQSTNENARLTNELDEICRGRDERRIQIEKLEGEKAALESRVSELEGAVKAEAEEKERIIAESAKLIQVIEQSKDEQQKSQQSIDELTGQQAQMQSQSDELRRELEEKQATIENLNSQVQQVKRISLHKTYGVLVCVGQFCGLSLKFYT